MKNPFSELLSDIISQSQISKNEMIRACDIDRSSFYKFLNGTRTPTMEQLNTICNKLQFSPMEEIALRQEYARITQGESSVRYRNRIASFLWDLEELENMCAFYPVSFRKEKPDETNETVICGKEKVLYRLAETILQEKEEREETFEVEMFVPAYAEGLFRWLVGFIQSGLSKQARILQLIEIPSKNLDSEQTIIDKIRLPLLCAMANPEVFTGFYYYSNSSINENVGVFYPFYLITDHRLVLMNERMDKAVVLADPGCCRDYKNAFLTSLNRSQPMLKRVENKDLEEELKKPIRFQYGSRRSEERRAGEETITFMSLSDIRDCLAIGIHGKSGKGQGEGTELSVRETVRLLEEVRSRLGSKVFLIDEKIIPPARTWNVALSGREKLVFCKKNNTYAFIVTEFGMVEAFSNYMEELPNSGSILRADLAAECMDRLLMETKNKSLPLLRATC